MVIIFVYSDYDKLDPSDIIGNCSLAFDVAESKLGIASLLGSTTTLIVLNFHVEQ